MNRKIDSPPSVVAMSFQTVSGNSVGPPVHSHQMTVPQSTAKNATPTPRKASASHVNARCAQSKRDTRS